MLRETAPMSKHRSSSLLLAPFRPRRLLSGIAGCLILILFSVLSAAPASAIGTPVPLGTAAPFSVLAGQSVTNTGPSVLDGSVGVSPGTAVSGFPPGTVGGTVHSADAVALQAQTDLTVAYNDAAGQTSDAAITTDLGGLTLVPGVYTAASTAGLTGTLTLNGQGNPNSVFIFQVGSSLTTASASSVSLINGAQACNVFWQIGASATLGTNSTFLGSILALTSITANTGTTVLGRALARNGSVTLDTNTFTTPVCASIPTSTATTTAAPITSSAATATPTASSGTPTVAAITPASGDVTGGDTVTVTGTGFVPGQTTVTVDNSPVPPTDVTVVSPTKLTFQLPAHPAGTVTITVTTAGGTSTAIQFTYTTGLAATGTSTRPLTIAVLLLLVGSAVLFASRRVLTSTRRH